MISLKTRFTHQHFSGGASSALRRNFSKRFLMIWQRQTLTFSEEGCLAGSAQIFAHQKLTLAFLHDSLWNVGESAR
jgi:hypothetical protein